MLTIGIILFVAIILSLLYWLFMSSYSQIFGKYYWKAQTKDKLIALTFDDGPNDPYTSQILDILDNFGIKATFFQVGKCVERFPKTTERVIDSGHTIGNHSLSHEFHRYFLSLNFRQEILENQAILKKHIDKTPALYRSPWLWRQPFLLKTLRTNGLVPISGEFCHPLEVLQIDAEKIAKTAIKKARPGSIIIFHDGRDGKGGNRGETVAAVGIVVDRLIKDGYSFVTVDKLLSIPAYQ
jgi:peptidoglycan/xylan/chitin deacetylase (PgdA/CDA1 family)